MEANGGRQYRFVTSTITADELAEAPSHGPRSLADTFTPEMVVDVTEDMEQLAAAYMAQAILTPKSPTMPAMCGLHRGPVDYLVSLELQAPGQRGQLLQGYPSISIINPWS